MRIDRARAIHGLTAALDLGFDVRRHCDAVRGIEQKEAAAAGRRDLGEGAFAGGEEGRRSFVERLRKVAFQSSVIAD